MEALLTLNELLRTAFANAAVGFTLRSRRHPLVYSVKGVQAYDTQSSTSEDIEELLRQLMTSREMRQFRARGGIQFKSLFEGHLSLHGKAKIEGDDIHVELRRIAA